jgi:hypothetical protein
MASREQLPRFINLIDWVSASFLSGVCEFPPARVWALFSDSYTLSEILSFYAAPRRGGEKGEVPIAS